MNSEMRENLGFVVVEKSLCGRYVRYEEIMGSGAFKDVYIGFDQVDNMEIAWNKICFDNGSTLKPPKTQETIFSEAVLLKSLNHRNIMKCYSYWVDSENKTMDMITELFSSGNLRQLMKKLGGVDIQTIKNWGRQILQGLEYLHSRKPCIVHRDLKCDNIFLDVSNGEIKIGDFGLAIGMEKSSLSALAGTPGFMAPEFYDEEYNELVDIYAFGMCLIELATFEYPYCECINPAQIFRKVSSGIKPSALGKVKDFDVKMIIEKCLLPVSLRPSAVELLNDPFFSSSETSMEIDHNSICLTMNPLAWTEDEYLGGESCCMTLSKIFASNNSYDDHGKKLQRSCYQSSERDDSMNSKITFASSSGAISKEFLFLGM